MGGCIGEGRMEILNNRAIIQFIEKQPRSARALKSWIATVKRARWKHPPDVLKAFNRTDCVNGKWIFNISGNNYRLAALIWFETKRVYVLKVMTHEEYDNEVW